MAFGDPAGREMLEEAQKDIRLLREAVGDLQRRLEKQAVLLRALFTLLNERQGLTEAEVLDRFRRVEAERAGAPAQKCAECGRAVNQRIHRCFYCGAACEVESAFELLDLGTWPNVVPPPGEQGIATRPGHRG
jgi:hypothetical protein